jgi:hypothetical protein
MFGVCVRVYSVFVLSRIQVEALRLADHSSKESCRLCTNKKKKKKKKMKNLDTVRVRYKTYA